MTVAYTIMFFAMIRGFVEALLMGAVFAGILYPVYKRLEKAFKGRRSAASLATLMVALLAIVIPLLFLLGMIVDQASNVANTVEPWIQQQIAEPGDGNDALPAWVPFAESLEPYKERISVKLGEFADSAASYLGASLARATEGTMSFFLSLFIMLYAMYFGRYGIKGAEASDPGLRPQPNGVADPQRGHAAVKRRRQGCQGQEKGVMVFPGQSDSPAPAWAGPNGTYPPTPLKRFTRWMRDVCFIRNSPTGLRES